MAKTTKVLPIIAGTLIYPHINKPQNKKDTGSSTDWVDLEYETQLLVTKADYKALKENYPTSTLPAAKDYTAKEFETKFKFKPDAKYATSDGEYYVIKFTKPAGYIKDGSQAPVPEVIGVKRGAEAGSYKDKEGKVFDQTVMLNGGTTGVLQFKARDCTGKAKGKVKLDIHKFQVHNLVEYVPSEEDSVFDIEEDDDNIFQMDDSDDSTETTKKATEADEEDDWDE